MAFIKKKLSSSEVRILESAKIVKHIIEATLKKSSWNSSHNPRFDAHRADTQFTATSTKYLFPAERSLLKLRSQHTRETNNFSALLRGEFFSSTFPKCALSNSRDGVCYMSHVILVSQSYYRVNNLGGKIPMASLLFVWPAGRSSPKRFAECCHKENFQDFSKPS